MKSNSIALVDPRCRIPYYTFILQGFDELGIRWRFKSLDSPTGNGMAIKFRGLNVWVDSDDMREIEGSPYEWADVVGKVNCSESDLSTMEKLVPIGPVFGTRYWRLPAGYFKIFPMLINGSKFRKAISDVRFQGISRIELSEYEKFRSNEVESFVYHQSRLWPSKHMSANHPRFRFIEAVKGLEIVKEVGFVNNHVPLETYLRNTSRSRVVFNCPAVHGCLGWKLGEYLALGKAIVSTPLCNSLPAPLVHGEHIHFTVDDVLSMREATELIIADDQYRIHLQMGARAWFDRNLRPAVVVERLLHSRL